MSSSRPRSNARTAVMLLSVVVGMAGLSIASVPLYRIFCQVTGFGGTTQTAEALPVSVTERTFKVRFDASTNSNLDWRFKPAQREITLRAGESGLAFYRAENLAESAITGTATFNVTPLKAGQYFNKVQCFCFDEQRLKPGEEVDMAVQFFIDPAIVEDRNLDEVKTITLSYTFFRAPDDAPEPASGNEQASVQPANTLAGRPSPN